MSNDKALGVKSPGQFLQDGNMKKITSFTIGGKEYPVKISYQAIRDMIERAGKESPKKNKLLTYHDWTIDTIMKVLKPNPFKSTTDLKNELEWDEYHAIDKMLGGLFGGEPVDPSQSSDKSTS